MGEKIRLPISGFVDLQMNGFRGIDFSGPDLTEEEFTRSSRALLRRGMAAFLPTVITSSEELYERNLPLIANVMRRSEFSGRILGIHVEGPFISPQPGAVGAHRTEFVREPDCDLLRRLHEWAGGTIRLLTIAAEVPGAEELARVAGALGIRVSVGHSMYDDKDLARLAAAGAVAITHLGNGLPNMIHRHHNPIWAALGNDEITVMLISDGHHLPQSALKSMIRAKGVARTIVVSDASMLAGQPPGEYYAHGNRAILEESGLLHNPDKGCLVGSSSTILECMNHLASLGLLTLEELMEVGYYNPLRLIGIDPAEVPTEPHLLYDEELKGFSVSS